MPLMICPDCGNQISDQATACIHCGRPNSNQATSGENLTTNAKSKSVAVPVKWIVLIVILVATSAGILAYIYAGRIYRDAKGKIQEVRDSEEVRNLVHGASNALDGEEKVRIGTDTVATANRKADDKAASKFQDGTKHYRKKEWALAEQAFSEALKLAPQFLSAKKYIDSSRRELNAESSLNSGVQSIKNGNIEQGKNHLKQIPAKSVYASKAKGIIERLEKPTEQKRPSEQHVRKRVGIDYGNKKVKEAIAMYREKQWAESFRILKEETSKLEGEKRKDAEVLLRHIREAGRNWILAEREGESAKAKEFYRRAREIDNLIAEGFHQEDLTSLIKD